MYEEPMPSLVNMMNEHNTLRGTLKAREWSLEALRSDLEARHVQKTIFAKEKFEMNVARCGERAQEERGCNGRKLERRKLLERLKSVAIGCVNAGTEDDVG
ncbi:hypothetical protein DSL72_003729 [Monilinia vaccinii-corymbosi]|uniref:Uncharacterized protein n=1 Tax=Monilinia vaccinii-corymbosi TaxID=61207 RepID=A0A8A3P6E9_9HELO|nr:hypothetical protein DSL72_003729 [Monilinia vaccinii-corymbosi]